MQGPVVGYATDCRWMLSSRNSRVVVELMDGRMRYGGGRKLWDIGADWRGEGEGNWWLLLRCCRSKQPHAFFFFFFCLSC